MYNEYTHESMLEHIADYEAMRDLAAACAVPPQARGWFGIWLNFADCNFGSDVLSSDEMAQIVANTDFTFKDGKFYQKRVVIYYRNKLYGYTSKDRESATLYTLCVPHIDRMLIGVLNQWKTLSHANIAKMCQNHKAWRAAKRNEMLADLPSD
jgi:hypothetical protein